MLAWIPVQLRCQYLVGSQDRLAGVGGAYAEAFVHGLSVGVGRAEAAGRLRAQQLPRRGSTASGGEHGWRLIDKNRLVMTLSGTVIG